MSSNGQIPIMLISDPGGRGHLSIEFSDQHNGTMRLFPTLSGSGLRPTADSISQLKQRLSTFGSAPLLYEDVKDNVLSKILRKMGYRAVSSRKLIRGMKISWASWNAPIIVDNPKYFGVAKGTEPVMNEKMHRMMLFRREELLGEIAFSDYGRFVRCKANQFAMEGFGMLHSDIDPSIIMRALSKELEREKKRYLILGSEFSDCSESLHPFPLWHMSLSSPKEYDHECHIAGQDALPVIAQLTSEYEGSNYQSALNGARSRFSNPSFKYITCPDNEGFALIKFEEGAQGLLHDLYISPKHQGKGLGDQLVRGSISYLSGSCIRIRLNTIYPRAKMLYEKFDYRTVYTDLCVPLNQKMMVPPAR